MTRLFCPWKLLSSPTPSNKDNLWDFKTENEFLWSEPPARPSSLPPQNHRSVSLCHQIFQVFVQFSDFGFLISDTKNTKPGVRWRSRQRFCLHSRQPRRWNKLFFALSTIWSIGLSWKETRRRNSTHKAIFSGNVCAHSRKLNENDGMWNLWSEFLLISSLSRSFEAVFVVLSRRRPLLADKGQFSWAHCQQDTQILKRGQFYCLPYILWFFPRSLDVILSVQCARKEFSSPKKRFSTISRYLDSFKIIGTQFPFRLISIDLDFKILVLIQPFAFIFVSRRLDVKGKDEMFVPASSWHP